MRPLPLTVRLCALFIAIPFLVSAQEIVWIRPGLYKVSGLLVSGNDAFLNSPAIGTIQQWDLASQRFIKTVASHYHGNPLALSPDGSTLVTLEDAYYTAPSIWTWNLTNGAAVRIPTSLNSRPSFLGIQASSNRVVFVDGPRNLRYWDLNTQTLLESAIPLADIPEHAEIKPVESKDGAHAGLIIDGQLRVYNLSTLQSEIIPTTNRVWFAAFSPDGQKVAAVTLNSEYRDPALRVWNRQTSQFENNLGLQAAGQPLFAPDRPIVAVAIEGEIAFWDLEQNQIVKRLGSDSSYNGVPPPIAFSGDGKLFISGASVVDLQTDESWSLSNSAFPAHNLAFSPDGSRLLVQNYGNQIWDVKTGKLLYGLSAPTPQAKAASAPGFTYGGSSIMRSQKPIFFDTGNKVTVGGSIFNLASQSFVSNLPRPPGSYGSVFALAPNRYFTAELNSFAAHIHNSSSGAILHRLAAPRTSGSTAIGVSHSGELVAAGGGYTAPADDFHNNRLHIWNTADGQLLTTLTNEGGFPWKIAFSRDDTYVASVSERYGVGLNVFDVANRRQMLALRRNISPSVDFDFLPDNRTIAVGHIDAIELWDIPSSNRVAMITNETHLITALAVSPDGKTIAASRWDGTLTLYKTPALDHLAIAATNGFYTLNFTARANTAYEIQSSPDLTTWTTVTNITGASSDIRHTINPTQTTYYRLR